ncbi:PIN-like domain-containing protein [Pseudomonas akapageensis]|uniref:PIN-like domain-containing protein n=1 Tax=Pseudomonas akapageensis TaxID=2609961 RepID=UPI00140E9030|nr:PIN domain-containing protein [Pseudomonas akapageensis]
MKNEFPGYFANGAADIEALWDSCLFILDANVLLSLYRYSDSTRSDLLQVFGALNDRLWVPNQVAYEYLNNRLSVIGDQVKIYDDAMRKTDALRKALESANQHPFVSPVTLGECNKTFEKLVGELGENKLVHERRINVDEIKDQLEPLLKGRVGSEYPREKIEQVITDGKLRYEEKIPPGFNDVKKGGESPLLSERRKPYGDYIVWLQMIDKAKELNKPVIFVTGDVKDDWWVTFNGKTVGPQPQLIQEFLLLTGQAFYMYSPDRFLERASTYLNQETSEQAVNEIRDVQEEEAESAMVDSVLNRWPSTRPDGLDIERNLWWKKLSEKTAADGQEPQVRLFVDLPWNSKSSRLDELSKEKNLISERGLELKRRLEEAKRRRDMLQEVVKRLSSHSSQVMREEAEPVLHEFISVDKLIKELEEELAGLRKAMWGVINTMNNINDGSGEE